MRGASARRTEREQARPPDAAEVIAKLGRVSDETGDLLGRMRQREAGDGCVSAAQVIDCGDHLAELRNLLEVLAPLIPSRANAYQAGREAMRIEMAAEQAAQPRPAGARHAARGRHLKVAGGAAVKATAVAAAGIVAAGGLAAMHEESSVRAVAASPAATPVLRVMQPPWPAVRIPSASPSPRPSAAAASARPAPKVTPSPPASVTAPAPPAPPPVPAPVPALSVPRLLDLGGSILGQLTLTAGPQAVEWTATATDGIRLSQDAGVAVAGQPVTLQVTDPSGDGGWVYVSFGPSVIPVHVVSALGVPVLALP